MEGITWHVSEISRQGDGGFTKRKRIRLGRWTLTKIGRQPGLCGQYGLNVGWILGRVYGRTGGGWLTTSTGQ
jgi:hypothetical protein